MVRSANPDLGEAASRGGPYTKTRMIEERRPRLFPVPVESANIAQERGRLFAGAPVPLILQLPANTGRPKHGTGQHS